MRKFASLGLIALLLVSTVAVVPSTASAAAPAPQGAGLLTSILNKMDRNRREMKTLRAGLWMQKYNAQIKDETNYVGDVQYIPGKGDSVSLRVDWRKPRPEVLSVLNGEYTLLKPYINTAYRGSTAAGSKNTKVNNVLGFGLGVSKAELSSKYNAEVVGEGTLEAGGPHVWMLKLTPKARAGHKYSEIWVTDEGMPIQTRVYEHNGDTTTVRLLNPQRNAPVSADAIKLNLGSDVKIVKG
jgi:outer membrane lipoprotein-sorting protein